MSIRLLSRDQSILPVPLGMVKEHCRVEHALDDALLAAQLWAAVDFAERHTNRALSPCVFRGAFRLPADGQPIRLARGPVRELVAVRWRDAERIVRTLDAGACQLVAAEPAEVVAVSGSWPAAGTWLDAIEVEFAAGYATPAEIPQGIRQALLVLVGHAYGERGDAEGGRAAPGLPQAALRLLDAHRVRRV